MNKNNYIKVLLFVILIVAILFITVFMFNSYKEKELNKLFKEKIEAEIQLKQYKKEYANRKLYIDSLIVGLQKKIAIIEYQKKFPKKIIKKYENKADSIINLSSSEQYKLFTNNLEKYQNNRERYSLSRFK